MMQYKNIKSITIFSMLAICILAIACKSEKNANSGIEMPPSESAIEKISEAATEAEPNIASLSQEQLKTIDLQYGTIENKQLTAIIKANGVLIVPNSSKANATSLYGGVVRSMNVHEGNNVSKGQVIATISNPQFLQLQEEYLQIKTKANLGSSEAASMVSNAQYAGLQDELATIEPKIKMAQLEVERQTELNAGNAGALKNLQQSKTDLSVLLARRAILQSQKNAFLKTTTSSNDTRKKSIETQLRLMGINPANVGANNLTSSIYVTSPISGTISMVMAKIGSYVDVQSPVAEIVNNSQLHLELNVFEKDLPILKIGQRIHFTLTNNPTKEYDATIYSIGSAFENASKTIPIHCELEGNKNGLIDGMNITALVSLNSVTTPAVPSYAIIESEGKTFIFIKENTTTTDTNGFTSYKKIEVFKGVSNLGFTAVSFVQDIAIDAKIVTKGAYFLNAKLTNVEEE
jgi:membrane fusion protein, heavy metal efflux system